ncbi:hypothetical protein HCH52_11950 [Oscillospiraceae bacterium HV4-5-C5C]|nr:hypothetical protein [Oscillospiraceae bacterium HV4-5-C5C]
MNNRKDDGTVTLEAALILPVSLWFILLLTAWQYISATEILLTDSLEILADEISFASSSLSLAESVWDQLELASLQGMDRELLDTGIDFITEEILRSRLYSYYRSLQQAAAYPRDYLVGLELELDKSQEESQSVWWITIHYQVDAVLGTVARSKQWAVGIWKPAAREEETEANGDQTAADESIWAADNFSRGRYFRNKYQANLPEFYPTIARYAAGTVTSIKSIDLNRATYQSSLVLEAQLGSMLLDLSRFSGSSQATELSEKPYISQSDIRQKKLLLIIPENHADWQASLIQHFSIRARAAGITVEVQPDGKSKVIDEPSN